jgi:(1->4)-alpha-D-glucan 1-alpha-D-glucosylmutase
VGARGANIIGVNPLHALFMHDAGHASHAARRASVSERAVSDIEAIPDFAESEAARSRRRAPITGRIKAPARRGARRLRGRQRAKRPCLKFWPVFARSIWRATAGGANFARFCAAAGALRRYALFEAIQSICSLLPGQWGWQQWPFQNPDPTRTQAWIRPIRRTHRIFQYLQWQAELQIAAVEERCFDAGLAIGHYAISRYRSTPAGPMHGRPGLTCRPPVGAPPDEFSMNSQNWGLPPPLPAHVAASGHTEFIAMVRANMVRGALADHVMGLARLLAPAGMDAARKSPDILL